MAMDNGQWRRNKKSVGLGTNVQIEESSTIKSCYSVRSYYLKRQELPYTFLYHHGLL
ncbi:MAG: hypothetical protein ACI90V_002673 [Bacillariaceae sp.]|jgi:hypothetical protein